MLKIFPPNCYGTLCVQWDEKRAANDSRIEQRSAREVKKKVFFFVKTISIIQIKSELKSVLSENKLIAIEK